MLELRELAAYAKEKYHIDEQRKWADFPGFSVLADPRTGKWLALLMRQWDSETGEELQRCDLKCGQQVLFQKPQPFLSKPFRMKGPKWVGVAFNASTDPEAVFRLFDQACQREWERGFTIVLESQPVAGSLVPPPLSRPVAGGTFPDIGVKVPEKIRQMLALYIYRDGSFQEKCRNFYRQGKFMEDYEDQQPWTGDYRRYFPTYHDLNVRQLRGYFTWRAQVRRGNFTPIATSLAYIYVYELLNGIGAASPQDSLDKLKAFEQGFLQAGMGEAGMEKNLRRWMLEFAVLHGLPPEQARSYAAPALLARDQALAVLERPQAAGDGEVVQALCVFAGTKLENSPVLKKGGEKGRRLFAAVWRRALERPLQENKTLFTACFGQRKLYPWAPLSNAVYWQEHPHPDTDYPLDACRVYRCRGGQWMEERFESLYFQRDIFNGLIHETDRRLRRFLKTGHYLREKPEEAWAGPLVEEALAQERAAALEAARPKVTIDLSHLERIRQDARHTRDSLLTEEELEESRESPAPPQAGASLPPAPEASPADSALPGLDAAHRALLEALLQGRPAAPLLQARRWMPSVVADTVNQALFDLVGDNVLECQGDTIALVEDYREEIQQLLGGGTP